MKITDFFSPFFDKKALTPPDQFSRGPSGVVGVPQGAEYSRVSHDDVDKHMSVYGGRNAVDYVMNCVDVYATNYADAPYHFEDAAGIRYEAREKHPDDPDDFKSAPYDLQLLLEYPNPQTDGNQMKQLIMIDYLMVGNSYWLKHGDAQRPSGLYRLDPRYVSIRPGKTRDVVEYVYQRPGDTERRYPVNKVVHIKRPNPHSPYFGVGVIAGGHRVIDIELAMSRSLGAYYENGTRLSGVLETERTLRPEMFNKIRRSFGAMYSGLTNSYNVAVLERGMKFKPTASSAAEAEYRYLVPQVRNRIAAMFKLPLSMVGEVGQNDTGGANKEARRTWANDIMKPLIGRIDSQLNAQLVSQYGLRLVTDYEYDMPIEDRFDLAASIAAGPGIRVREYRDFLNLPPLGEEEIDDMVLNLPGDNENESEVKDRPLGDEGGRPPKGENTRAFPRKGERLPKDAEVKRG